MLKEIEKKMLNYAKEFQFEKAAILRDQIKKIKVKIIMLLNEKLNRLLIGSGGREHAIASSIYNFSTSDRINYIVLQEMPEQEKLLE